ncbi:MAG TPA: NAD(P)H-dependent glycerol-3-phosphate dehydrogenase [Bryobacteraceae bacterium]|nr:NAD(P)H-dependent glycerol-3-phosphate dehydrogenase [Bryobacteraceae bacterium]
MSRLSILGAGSWGTALAIALSPRFESVQIWTRNAGRAAEIDSRRENARYLPGFRLAENITVSSEIAQVAASADFLLAVVPSEHLRQVLESARPFLPAHAHVVSATKGIEQQRLCRMSSLASEALDRTPIAVLSGPTFAKEIAAGEPAAVVIACQESRIAEHIQHAFSTNTLRFYTSTDVIGVELGAALKNVIAIGAGICHGLGLGSNSIAALVTRGLAEITRLAVHLGAEPRTLSGLAGLGDLVLTTTGNLSRNRYVGTELGQGRPLQEILAGMTMIAEGVSTCRAAHQLALRHSIEMPIVHKMYEILYESKDPRRALRELMDRPLTSE